MWAFGRYDLNLSEVEFWNLTLKELNALIERCNSNDDRQNYRTALLCSVIANTVRNRKKKARPFTPEDFLPNKRHGAQTVEQMLAQAKANNAILGGKVVED